MRPRHLVVMGVSGTGKTTIGETLAARLDSVFVEGDTYHPRANVEKMSKGIPLDDDDRRPWLDVLGTEIQRQEALGRTSVTACSALRRRYRDWLRDGYADLFFLHLDADYDTLHRRMERREHFMPASLLRSQFDTLEPLETDEAGAAIDDTRPIDAVLTQCLDAVAAQGDRS
ncbi:gluconokinase [Nocardioides insulae]|uniref:gluconokinase n=1 Tax=Nocardioides insulae TaxID=394734 RepID=UPI00040915CD|nr:gluconokinase [Nocardioides insulae]